MPREGHIGLLRLSVVLVCLGAVGLALLFLVHVSIPVAPPSATSEPTTAKEDETSGDRLPPDRIEMQVPESPRPPLGSSGNGMVDQLLLADPDLLTNPLEMSSLLRAQAVLERAQAEGEYAVICRVEDYLPDESYFVHDPTGIDGGPSLAHVEAGRLAFQTKRLQGRSVLRSEGGRAVEVLWNSESEGNKIACASVREEQTTGVFGQVLEENGGPYQPPDRLLLTRIVGCGSLVLPEDDGSFFIEMPTSDCQLVVERHVGWASEYGEPLLLKPELGRDVLDVILYAPPVPDWKGPPPGTKLP